MIKDRRARLEYALEHVGHPARLLILECALEGRFTPKGVYLEQRPARYTLAVVAYHVRALVATGMLHHVHTDYVRGAARHHYEATARARRVMGEVSALYVEGP